MYRSSERQPIRVRGLLARDCDAMRHNAALVPRNPSRRLVRSRERTGSARDSKGQQREAKDISSAQRLKVHRNGTLLSIARLRLTVESRDSSGRHPFT